MTMESDETKSAKSQRKTFYETTRMILLAGVGAVSLAQDEVNNFIDRLVERGQMAENDARSLVREVMDRREKLEQERREQARQSRQTAAQPGAQSTTQPAASKSDIEALSSRVAELTRQIEELRRQQGQ